MDSARGEARTAFGNDAVLVEKFVAKPRHIEVQVFGDGTHAVHLFERDCSLQRRHQKVIEEAPAPGMTAEMREAMGQAGVRAAEAIGYKGAGTVEFIVDASDGLRPDRFWFMEMNTRLQVEHPVDRGDHRESIWLNGSCAWQRARACRKTSVDDLSITGHAFEARLVCRGRAKGLSARDRNIDAFAFPAGCRADSGVRAGDTISPWYDPMIAKVIVHGPDARGCAWKQLHRACNEKPRLAGTVTNLAFLGALTRHAGALRRGDVDTGLIGRDLDRLGWQASDKPRTAVNVLLQRLCMCLGCWRHRNLRGYGVHFVGAAASGECS